MSHFAIVCNGNLQRNKLKEQIRVGDKIKNNKNKVLKNYTRLGNSPPLPPFNLGVYFCACSGFILGIAHTRESRKSEDNRGIINIMAYHRHHS